METTQILVIITCVLLSVGWFRFRKRCPNCSKWNGLKKINSEHDRTETRYSRQKVTTTKKDESFMTTGTSEKEESVPYSVSYYKVTYSCKSCNQEVQRTTTMVYGKYLIEAVILFIICLIISFMFISPKGQNEIYDYLQNFSSPSEIAPPKRSQPEPLSKTIEKTTNIESSQTELEEASMNEKQIDEQEINKQIIITEETPDYLKRELAIKMLEQGKRINEIADSTFLEKKEIRKLKRSIKKR